MFSCISEILIPHLGNLDIGDRTGKTALHHAAYNGHLEMLSLLLVKGANVKAVDRKEKTALHYAAFMGELCHSRYLFWDGANGVMLTNNLSVMLAWACPQLSS